MYGRGTYRFAVNRHLEDTLVRPTLVLCCHLQDSGRCFQALGSPACCPCLVKRAAAGQR